ncbi:MFS transporter [Nocardioides sp. R-C-SC26]|uniref:MFS transporter n=1 Tax=Nocardioides sp. R-C-SC26 TaxID=2870414 RepID=UPI001E4AFB93|nr:MFS transporter [Nocardioides sp. R-C-SC26]
MTQVDRRTRGLLTLAALAVAFAAVDTYVVVLALPDMMASTGIGVQELQRAAPIVSGFLLGYVAMLPLIGRVSDLRGPVPVLTASLIAFVIGSVVTAAAYDLTSMVVGRFLQGVGGGGLVPATMSLVAALYPVERRGLPLGLVSAVQEFGAVIGPLFGAAVLTVTTWRGIFAINAAVGLLLYVAIRLFPREAATSAESPGDRRQPERVPRGVPDILGAALLLIAVVAAGLTVNPPTALYTDLTWGELYVPVTDGGGRWLQPVGLIAIVAFVLFWVRCVMAQRPLLDVRAWGRTLDEADGRGSALLCIALAGIVLAFATADPEVSVFSPQGPWFLTGSAVAAVSLVFHVRQAPDPILPRGVLAARAAWGGLVVSLLVGWALIAALVDIPLFARTAEESYDQLDAALVLLRFLVALPIGAVIGGYLVRRLDAGVVTAIGMAAAAASFAWMSTWDRGSLDSALHGWVPLALGGLGFGLALAPVNAAVLASTRDDSHGLASALVVVARMVGMLVGISVLTTWGLSRLYAERDADPSLGLRDLGMLQEQAVFQGAAAVAALAAALALVLFRGAPTRGTRWTPPAG